MPRITSPPVPAAEPPQTQPCWSSGKLADQRSALVGADCESHVAPSSVLCRMTPPSPTAQPVVAVVNCRPLIWVNSFSSGRATALAIVAGLAPG